MRGEEGDGHFKAKQRARGSGLGVRGLAAAVGAAIGGLYLREARFRVLEELSA
jgi:hypothetical protein